MNGENGIVYYEKSGRPPIWIIIGTILFIDFVLAIIYGVAMEAPLGDMDAQMRYAPAFVLIVGCFSVAAFIMIYKAIAALNTYIEIYKDKIVYRAAKLVKKEKRVTSHSSFVEGILTFGEIYTSVKSTKNKKQYMVITKRGEELVFIRSSERDIITQLINDKVSQSVKK